MLSFADKIKSKKKKGLKEKIFTSFLSAVEVSLATGIGIYAVVENPYAYYYELFSDHKKGSVRKAVGDLVRVGLLKKVIKNGKPCFKLTGRGKEELVKLIPLKKWKVGEWDGKFRLISFDIPERMNPVRDALRVMLKSLGFGMWYQSLYISPQPIEKEMKVFIGNHNLEKHVTALIAEEEEVGEGLELAERVWKVSDYNKKYLDLAAEWRNRRFKGESKYKDFGKRKESREKRSLKEIVKLAQTLSEKYIKFILNDPYLPPELLPEDWAAEEAHKTFLEMQNFLKEQKVKSGGRIWVVREEKPS